MVSASASSELAPYVPRLAGRGDLPVELDATILFADFSGFTRMAERLAATGRTSGEELSRVVSGGFERVLEPVLDRGGDVLSFGGDSATVLFAGPDGVDAAVAAAGWMQRTLDGEHAIETAAGRLRVRLSMGIASGPVQFAAVGASGPDGRRVPILTGAAVQAAQRAEAAAPAGSVFATSAVADVASAAWRRVDEDHRRLRWRADLPDTRSAAPGSDADPAVWLPSDVARRISTGGSDGGAELRRATVAFVRVTRDGSVSPDDAHAAGRAVLDAADAHGVCLLGSDVCIDGVTFVVTAGAPTTHEDDPARITAFAREIAEVEPTARVGIDAGVVFAGAVGHPRRRAWTVMGDAVNVAARLSSRAEPGQVLMTGTVDLPRGVVATTQGPMSVKGRRQPVATVALDSTTTPVGGRHVSETPLVGRDEVLAAAVQRWSRAGDGAGSALAWTGPAGIGKTRMLREIAERCTGATVATSGHHGPGSTRPFAAADHLLRSVLPPDAVADAAALEACLAAEAPHLRPWSSLIADVLGLDSATTPAVERLATSQVARRRAVVLVDLLAAVAAGPTLFAIDDHQWLDAASTEIVDALLEAAPDQRWMVVLAGRTVDGACGDIEFLPPLDDDAASALVASLTTDRPLRDDQVRAVLDAAHGIPLYLEQLTAREVETAADLPEDLERLVAARIDGLPDADRRLLQVLAVFGERAPLADARTIAGDGEPLDQRRLHRLRGLVTVDGDHAILASAVVRTVAYETMTVRRRRRIHHEIAALLERRGRRRDPVRIEHLLATGDPSAWEPAIALARQTADRHAPADAIAIYERALALPRRDADVPDDAVATSALELGRLCLRAGRLTDADAACRRAAASTDDARITAAVRSVRADVALQRGDLRSALRWTARGLRALDDRPGDPDALTTRVHLLGARATARMHQDRHDEAVALARQAAELADEAASIDLLARTCQDLEMVLSAAGDLAGARIAGEQAIEHLRVLDAPGPASGLHLNLGVSAVATGRWDDAIGHYDQATALAETAGVAIVRAVSALNRGFLLLKQGRPDEVGDVDAVVRAFRAEGHDHYVGYARTLEALVHAWHRRVAEARAASASALAIFETVGAASMHADATIDAAVIDLLDADPASARAALLALVEVVDELDDRGPLAIKCRIELSRAAARSGDAESAIAAATDARDWARKADRPFEIALALDVLGHAHLAAGQPPDDDDLRERDELLASLGVRRTLFPQCR